MATIAAKGLLLVCAMAMCTTNAYSVQNTNSIAQLVDLARSGKQMDLRAVGHAIGEPNLYDLATFKHDVNHSAGVWYTYHTTKTDNPIAHVQYKVWLDMYSGFAKVLGAVDFTFKKGSCPSIADFERVAGVSAQKVSILTFPSLLTGQGSTYARYYLQVASNKTLDISADGCQVAIYSRADLS